MDVRQLPAHTFSGITMALIDGDEEGAIEFALAVNGPFRPGVSRDEAVDIVNAMKMELAKGPILDLFAERVHRANKKWWEDLETGEPIKRNVGEMLMLICSEMAEAMEGDRKGLQDDKLPEHRMFDVEMIDGFIRMFDVCRGKSVKIGQIFEDKMAFNAVRADHQPEHRKQAGGKKY